MGTNPSTTGSLTTSAETRWPMVEAPAGNRLLPAPLKIPQTRFTVISKRGGGLVLHPRDRLRASAWDKVGAWLHRRGAGICRRQKMPRN